MSKPSSPIAHALKSAGSSVLSFIRKVGGRTADLDTTTMDDDDDDNLFSFENLLKESRWRVGQGDAWFGSIPAIVELKNKMNIYSTQYFPKQVLHKVLMACYPRYLAGHHVMMKATIVGVDLFALAYAY